LGYLQKFSATEKVVFGIFAAAALVTAIIMALKVNAHFTVEIPGNGGTLHEGLVGLPHTINPILAVTDVDRDIASVVYSGLTRYQNGNIVPDLAQSWSVSDDGLTYTFTLKPGIEFQDGSPITTADIAYTIEKVRDTALKSPRALDWAGVTVIASSSSSISFTLKQPYSSFLANTTIGILPKHIWGSVSDDQFIFSQYNIDPIGSGPFKVTGIDRNQGGIPTDYNLSSWNDYAGKRPHISNIIFSFFPDEEHALSALENGSIDSLPSISPDQAVQLTANKGEPYTVISSPLARIFGVFFNQNVNPILADSVVRQALGMAVDRSAVIKNVLQGYGIPVFGPLPPGIKSSGATSSASIATTGPSAAQALLEKNGWKKNASGIYEKKPAKGAVKTLAITLYTADSPELKQAADIVSKAWTAVGAKVDVRIFEPNELYQNVIRTRTYDSLLFGEAVGKDNDLYAFWHSSQRNAPGLNVAMYANSKVDKLLESIRTMSDPDARASAFGQLSQTIGADMPAIFLYAPDFVYAVPKNLMGADLGTVTTPTDRFASVSSWYLGTERVWPIFSKK
jgi:peptide/nickel transport system substrate-binding protein